MDIAVVKQQISQALEKHFFKKDKEVAAKALDETKKMLELVNKFIEIKEREGLESSKSPYSASFYLLKKGEHIDWEYKPEGSYRLADHWNFYSEGKQHCISNDIRDDEFAIGIFCNGKYKKVI